MVTIQISLPEQLKAWVDGQAGSDVSTYIENLIKLEALRQALKEGEESGISERSVDEIVTSAKAKLKNAAL